MSWNFHGRIAYPLELDARTLLSDKVNDANCRETIFSADSIETGCFVEVMILLLRHKSGYAYNEDIDEFVKDAGRYLGKDYLSIPSDEDQRLFDRYKELLEQTMKGEANQ